MIGGVKICVKRRRSIFEAQMRMLEGSYQMVLRCVLSVTKERKVGMFSMKGNLRSWCTCTQHNIISE